MGILQQRLVAQGRNFPIGHAVAQYNNMLHLYLLTLIIYMSYVGNTHDVGKNTGRRHSGPGSVSLNLHGILLIALCRQ